MLIVLSLLALTSVLAGALSWVAAYQATLGVLTFPPLNAPHLELLGVGMFVITTLCLVGIGILYRLDILIDVTEHKDPNTAALKEQR
jgi:hypothetical protein